MTTVDGSCQQRKFGNIGEGEGVEEHMGVRGPGGRGQHDCCERRGGKRGWRGEGGETVGSDEWKGRGLRGGGEGSGR